jgi:V8-like Glu-specific endopeptidase
MGGKRNKKIHKQRKKQQPNKFKDDQGNIITPIELVFPIIKKVGNEYECVGTGFFVHPAGGFVTAKHVLYENDKFNPIYYAIHTIGKNMHFARKIIHFQGHPIGDIGMGMLDGELKNRITGEIFLKAALPVSKTPIGPKDKISTLAYPRMKIDRQNVGTFPCDKFSGEVIEHLPEGTSKLKSECYVTNMHVKSGASGGPVLRGFHVVGVNSSSYQTAVDQEPISFITPIHLLFDLELTEGDGSKVTVKELMENGNMHFVP